MADNYEETSSSVAHQAMEDHVLDKPQKGKGKGKGGGGGGGGRRGGNRETQVSKALSRLLRHQAENAGIKLDGEGFAPLDRVVSLLQRGIFFYTFSLFHHENCSLLSPFILYTGKKMGLLY